MRVLRTGVMVRVAGGWESLENFLVKYDPFRGIDYCTNASSLFLQPFQTFLSILFSTIFPYFLSQISSLLNRTL